MADWDAFAKVKGCAALVAARYPLEAAIVAVTKQVPEVVALIVVFAVLVSERAQPVAVPSETA